MTFFDLLPIALAAVILFPSFSKNPRSHLLLERVGTANKLRAGYKDQFASAKAFYWKWYLIRVSICLPLALIIPALFFNDWIRKAVSVAVIVGVSNLLDKLSWLYWLHFESAQLGGKRFSPPTPPPPVPSGEHGSARLQGAADLAAAGFIDEA